RTVDSWIDMHKAKFSLDKKLICRLYRNKLPVLGDMRGDTSKSPFPKPRISA
ncbi:hypothetical protein E4U53_005227, partial [Claviceps sorghi]